MKKLLAPILLCVMLSTGCSTSWLSTFDSYLSIIGPVLTQILDIVALAQGQPPNAQLAAKIAADQAAANSLAASVNSATAQNVTGACAAFNLGVQTFADDLTQIETIVQINNLNTQGEIAAGVGIAQAAMAEIEAPIAACQAAPSQKAALQVLKSYSYKLKGGEDVARRFNAVVDSKHHVHYHSKWVRILSLGHEQ